MAILGSLTLELVFILSLVAFLVLVELTAPVAVRPGWRRRLRWITVLGLLVFGYLVVRRVLAILSIGGF